MLGNKDKTEKKDKVSAEVVDAEFADICDFFRINLDDLVDKDDRGFIEELKYHMRRGDVTFKKDNQGEFDYKLWEVITVAGNDLTNVKIGNLRAEQFINIEKAKGGDLTKAIHLVTSCSDQPLGIIKRLSTKDLNFLGQLCRFFT